MSEIKVASRYAKSILGLAQERNNLDAVKNDMVLLNHVLNENTELGNVLKNPIIPLDKKVSVLNGIFQGKVSEITLLFFKLTIQKGRAPMLHLIAKSFISQYNEMNGIVIAEVVSAGPLDEQAKAEVIRIVKNEIGAKEVILKTSQNPKLIGGFIIKVGDIQYDASIANKFVKLRKELGATA